MPNGLFQVGDYIRYQGNHRVQGILRDPGIGRIEEFHTPFDAERIYLFLTDHEQHIWCDYYDIRMIQSDESLLVKMGFQEEERNRVKLYRLNNITLSGCYIALPGHMYMAGICQADFSVPGIIQLNNYIDEDNSINQKQFHEDFPSMNDINDVARLLHQNNIPCDLEAILTQ